MPKLCKRDRDKFKNIFDHNTTTDLTTIFTGVSRASLLRLGKRPDRVLREAVFTTVKTVLAGLPDPAPQDSPQRELVGVVEIKCPLCMGHGTFKASVNDLIKFRRGQ